MYRQVILVAVGILSVAPAQAGEIFDTRGDRIFYTEETGETRQVEMRDGRQGTYYELRLVHEASGRTFEWDAKWDQVSSDGELFMDYVFNKRQWNWVEGTGVVPCKDKSGIVRNCSGASDTTRRSYQRENFIFTTPDQGEYPILTYKEGVFLSEFDEPVYTLKGGLPAWCEMVMLHYYYEENYNSAVIKDVEARRAVNAGLALESNGIASDMVKLAHEYETLQSGVFGPNYKVRYFTQIEGTNTMLSEEQVLQIRNRWLVLNEKTWRRSGPPHDLPQGGFLLSKREVKDLGVSAEKNHMVIMIRIKPEFLEEFRAAVLD